MEHRDEEKREAKSASIVNVGSRKSQLALIQTNLVVQKLEDFYSNNPDRLKEPFDRYELFEYRPRQEIKFNVVSMSTTGDKVLDKSLPAIGTKSLFTRELEIALLERRVDFVVHSLKDLPTTLPEGCVIGAIIARDNPDDVIVLKSLLRSQIKPLDLLLGRYTKVEGVRFKIGTSSQRRIAMIKRCNQNLECIDIRGNLNTRFSKLDSDNGEYDAIILAKAGLDRMGWSDRASSLLTPKEDQGLHDWCYAVGQGAIAVECRSDDQYILDLLRPIVDFQTIYEVIAERSFMRKLEGGCSVPLGVRSTWIESEGKKVLNLESIVLSVDGRDVVRANGRTHLFREGEVAESEETDPVGLLTTGITLSEVALSSSCVKYNMAKCSELGMKVANKMINLGCLELMGRGKH